MALLCIDIGGTAVKTATWENDTLSHQGAFPTPNSWDRLKEEIKRLLKSYDGIEGIAISSPGSVDSHTGLVGGISSVPYIHHFSIKDELNQAFHLPISIENDANCAALAEVYYGAAKEVDNSVLFVIGSGIGGAVIINRQLLKGANLFGGEIGYMMISDTGIASHHASPVQVAKRNGFETGLDLFNQAEEENPVALQAIEGLYDAMARSLYNVSLLLNPQRILVGGGISRREDLIPQVKKRLKAYLEENGAHGLEVDLKRCQFGPDANLIGAAVNFYLQEGKLD